MAEIRTFDQARQTNALVHAVMTAGGTAEDACVALVNQVNALLAEVIRLDAVAPKKYRLPDGRVFVWRCPDHRVPDALAPDAGGR